MLQDLDYLAARIGQIVQSTRELQAERSTLLARIAQLEKESAAIREQQAQQQAEHAALQERIAAYESETQALTAKSEAVHAGLQAELFQSQGRCEELGQQLQASRSDTTRLRSVVGQAKERVDSILMRLPGAPQE